MSRKKTERIGRIMEEVRRRDAERGYKPKPIPNKRIKPKAEPPRKPKYQCCLDKYDDLPASFVVCYGCPKDESTA